MVFSGLNVTDCLKKRCPSKPRLVALDSSQCAQKQFLSEVKFCLFNLSGRLTVHMFYPKSLVAED